MYAVNEGVAIVNDQEFTVFNRQVETEKGILDVTAGTTGFKGGEREAGGRTYLSIEGCACIDMHADLKKDEDGDVTGIELAFCGDNELDALIRALLFAQKTLVDQATGDDD